MRNFMHAWEQAIADSVFWSRGHTRPNTVQHGSMKRHVPVPAEQCAELPQMCVGRCSMYGPFWANSATFSPQTAVV